MISKISHAQTNLIPEPAFHKAEKGKFIFTSSTQLRFPDCLKKSASIFIDEIKLRYDVDLSENIGSSNLTNFIHCKIDSDNDKRTRYDLQITPDSICISGNESGIFYAFQSILFLLPNQKKQPIIAAQTIIDSPRFDYRGLHLDVSRHFRSAAYIKKYLDIMAMHKLNRFHWHLTDDQGWRIEIKKYPELTNKGSRRKQTLIGPYGTDKYDNTPHEGFYTQEEIADIVKYAEDRKITIIPEIEMPGHSSAALASYPFLGCTQGPYQTMETWGVSEDVICAGSDSSYEFLEHVIDEVISLFPGPYIHIGGDECPKTRWKNCSSCQKKMKEMKLKDEHELQSYFVKRIERHINKRNKIMIGWDEILEGGLAPNAVVMSWRGESGGIEAAKLDHNVIMTPGKPLYFDHSQSLNEDSVTQGGLNSLEMVYQYHPIPNELNEAQSAFIMGAQANMWTEYMNNEKKIEYMLLPRLAALSEAVWSNPEKKNWNRFQQKLPSLLSLYEFMGLNSSKAYYDLEPQVTSNGKGGLFWNLKSRFPNAKIITQIPSQKQQSFYNKPIPIKESGEYKSQLKDRKGNSLSSELSQLFSLHKASGMKCSITPSPDFRYPGNGALTLVDGIMNEKGLSASSQFVGFWGKDVVITIDLGKQTAFNTLTLRFFEQAASWIYTPDSVSVWLGDNLSNLMEWQTNPIIVGKRHIAYQFNGNKSNRFVQIRVTCKKIIPGGLPGAGNPAWLFMDEFRIE